MPALGDAARAALAGELARALAQPGRPDEPMRITIGGAPHLLFSNQLNPGAMFPPAYEVCIYPLAELLARQRQLRWQALGAGALLLFGGLVTSNFLSRRLSRPVERLAVDSEENRLQRARAEAALEATNVELQRSARFSADASHQLKTPVTVLRAGLEELLASENLAPAVREELGALVHQTFRLSSVIDDLLLLSRVDAGRLTLELGPVDLTHLIESALDDLSAQPDAPELTVETDFPRALHIAGEKRYTALILQNLLENARKYNRPGGRIRVAASEVDGAVRLIVGNTGQPIPPAAQAHIFERFHRGAMGENVPGYGLGLNLAREIARLHHGDLKLARSGDDWTEFEVSFRAARPVLSSLRSSA
jgi:signal transduction histidine kinase